ncbi:MAG TPA: hypothetical protein VFY39_03455 [Gammaproteobacteria bacterium]|nr:hypothetical protein [Gammaproteobacteria bacterium]
MTSRREFLQIGIAAGAWPLAPGSALSRPPAAGSSPSPSYRFVPLYKVVFDTRFPASLAFAARARELGLGVHGFEGDITAFWYQELDGVWRRASAAQRGEGPPAAAIAGLTAHGPLFCLEHLAWERGLRVVFRAEHAAQEAGVIEHRLSGPADMLHEGRHLAAAGEGWAPRLAEMAVRCPRGRTEISSARIRADVPSGSGALGETLYSWVIAPAARASAG